MSNWIRIDRDLLDNAKVIGAGQDAALLLLEILAVNDRGSRDGKLTPMESTATFLARRLRMSFEWDEERAAAALQALTDWGLIHREADLSIRISGWDDEWRPPLTEAERARAARNRRKPAATPVTSTVTTGVTTPVTDGVTSTVTTRPSVRPSVRPQRNATQRPSSNARAREGPEDGPDQDHAPQPDQDQPLRELGMADAASIAKAKETLALFDKPGEVLEVLERHVRRFGKNPPALLARVLADPQQVRKLLQEAADKAGNEALRLRIRTLIAGIEAKTRTA